MYGFWKGDRAFGGDAVYEMMMGVGIVALGMFCLALGACPSSAARIRDTLLIDDVAE